MRQQHAQMVVVTLLCVACGLYITVCNRSQRPADPIKPSIPMKRSRSSSARRQVWIIYTAGWGAGNETTDGTWGSWRIRTSSWTESYHEPPDDIAIVHEPLLGIYSSHNASVLKSHLKVIQEMGVDAIVVPWDGVWRTNGTSSFTDQSLKMLFGLCPSYNLEIIPFIPSFEGRNGTTVQADLDYFVKSYAKEKAQYRWDGKPLLIVYDAHELRQAAEIVDNNAELRFMASSLSYNDFLGVFEDGFVGFVTYFASDETSWGSNHENWGAMMNMSVQRGMALVPTVSPGFNDSVGNRWNSRNWRARDCDGYYKTRWNAALAANAEIVMINSWNSWVEGSGIEPVVDSVKRPLSDKVWCGKEPDYYVKKTTEWIQTFKDERS